MVALQCQAMAEDAFGPIFLALEGAAFPEEGWEDFAGLMLLEWLASSVRWLQDETAVPCIYRFMEVPTNFTPRASDPRNTRNWSSRSTSAWLAGAPARWR